MYESLREAVYPKYSVMDPRLEILSGFSEQSVHLYTGFGMPGAILHGIIGMIIDVTNVAAAMIPEYINFFLNCMFSYGF